jgi:hypothetical protein
VIVPVKGAPFEVVTSRGAMILPLGVPLLTETAVGPPVDNVGGGEDAAANTTTDIPGICAVPVAVTVCGEAVEAREYWIRSAVVL